MGTVTFRQLPMIAKVAVGIAFLEAWVSLEQLVIEPTGLWHYMPFYRVGGFCVYDFTVTLLVVAGLWLLSQQREERRVQEEGTTRNLEVTP
ncbi:MAG TPA: hypothetical protein VGO18_40390 [Steroidobacteraceae bacterium]|nr:hypothetical protein [Steroidobacteraceae bacterium]